MIIIKYVIYVINICMKKTSCTVRLEHRPPNGKILYMHATEKSKSILDLDIARSTILSREGLQEIKKGKILCFCSHKSSLDVLRVSVCSSG
jgi:hypothetical protein